MQSLTSGLGKFDKFGTATGLFKNVGISAEDLSALKEYKTLLNDGVTDTEKFSEVMSKMSPNAKAMAADVKSGAISIETLSSAEKAATISTKLLGTAFKMLASIGVMLAINGIVSYFQKVAQSEKDAKEKAEENAQALNEQNKANKESLIGMSKLVAQYKELSSQTNLTSDDKSKLKDIQEELNSSYNLEAEGLDLVNGKYKEQTEILDENLQKKYDDWKQSATQSLNNDYGYTKDNKSLDLFKNVDLAGYGTELALIRNELNGIDGISYKKNKDGLVMLNDLTIDASTSKNMTETLNQAIESLQDTNATNLKQSPIYKILMDSLLGYKEHYSEEIETVVNDIQDNISTFTFEGISFDEVTSETYNSWSQAFIKQFSNGEEDLEKLMSEQLQETFQKLSNIDENGNKIVPTFDISDYTDALDTVQDKASSLSKTLQSLTDGSITDTDLIDLFQNYPDLAQYAGDTDKLKTGLQKLIKQNPQDLIVQLKTLKDSLPDGADKKQVEGLISTLKKLGDTASDINGIKFTADEIVSAYESRYDKVIDSLEEEKDLLSQQKEILSKKKEELEAIVSQYESAESAVERYIDTQKSALEDEKSAIEDKYNAEIEAIQNANDEKQTSIDLQEKLDALNNGKKKKVAVYSESRGWNIQTNTSEVQKLQQDYDSAVADKRISDLEKQRDNEISIIDKQIEEWEDYAKSWQESVNEIKNADDDLITSKILGSDWTEKISEKDTGILNNFANNYRTYQTKLNNEVDKELEAIENSIEAKQDQIDMYTKEKNALSRYIDTITSKNEEYLDSLGSTADIEHSTMQERVDFLNKCKEEARKALDWSDLNTEDVRQNSGFIVQYNGNAIGTAQDEIEAQNIKASYIGKILSAQLATMNNVSSSDIIRLQEEIASRFDVIRPYKNGGTNDYTGLAMLHGTPNSSETIFNATQSKKLYDLVANSDNLVSYIGNKIVKGLSNATINNNTPSNTYILQFSGDIVGNDSPEIFMRQMDAYLTQANLDRMVGK